jgi:putative peptidoglycan lipid II flippase
MRRARGYTPRPGWARFLVRVVIALSRAASCCGSSGRRRFWLHAGLWGKVGRLAWVIAAGTLSYFAVLWLLGFRLADFSRHESA